MDRLLLVLALLLASAFALAQPLYEQALNAERSGDPKAAVKLYTEAARAGDGKAAYRLGEIYEKGLGVPADQDQSKRWFNAARTLGYPPLVGDFPPRRDQTPKPR